MKQKRTSRILLTAALLLCLVSTGCTGGSCFNCAMTRCGEGLACSLECSGEFNDCGAVLCNAFMGEACADTCYVAPCYVCAGTVRLCAADDCGTPSIMKNSLEKLNADDYSVTFGFQTEGIYNLTEYYKVTVTATVLTSETLKDVIVSFSVKDVNGNSMESVDLYIADKIKGGDYNAESASITFTFKYPEKNHIGAHSDEYRVDFTNVTVYGRS